MSIKNILPSEIEKESFRIIRAELLSLGKEIPAEVEPTVVRVIHTTADFEYADTMRPIWCESSLSTDLRISPSQN